MEKNTFISFIIGMTLSKVINVHVFDEKWMNSFLIELPIVLVIYLVIWLLFLKKRGGKSKRV